MLYRDFLNWDNPNKAIMKWIHCFPIYERHFKKFVDQSVNFWEIGVSRGGSLQMWKSYFGPFARIIGIDINPLCKRHEDNQISVCIGDQSDASFLQEIIDIYGLPDIVLDDGSHIMKHICASFDFLYNKVSKNGVYMVEDLHFAYDDSFGGGLRREGTFIERCKNMIDLLNARHYSSGDEQLSFANSTYSMCLYDSVAVFEKIEWSEDSWKAQISPKNFKMTYSVYQVSNNNQLSSCELVGKRIIIFGAGKRGDILCDLLKEDGFNIEYCVDNDEAKHGTIIDDVRIISPRDLRSICGDYYIISVENKEAFDSIFTQLKALDIEEEKICGAMIL